ncbi:MAG: DUF503 domain-containing protein [Planctomycetes bacterium]|nr:DUF503 domain-containing protein [Planctomycetota bacterium]
MSRAAIVRAHGALVAMLYIGVLQFSLEIPYAESLKDKRNVIKALKDRLRRSFNVSLSEIEDLDQTTVATLGAVVAGSDTAHLNSTMDHLLNELKDWRDGTLVDHQLEIISPH